jgi:hypothetical protein
MARRWYYKELGDAVGPMRASELVELARTGDIGPDTLVRRDQDGNWVPASKVRGLAQVVTARPAASTDASRSLGDQVSEILFLRVNTVADLSDTLE